MSADLQFLITVQGMQAALQHDGIALKITHVSVGDSGYTLATSSDDLINQATLHNERARTIIASAKETSAGWDVSAIFDEDNIQTWVKEIGLHLEDGTLFAVWANTQALAWKAKNIDLVIAGNFVLNALPAGSVQIVSGLDYNLSVTEVIALLSRGIAQESLANFNQDKQLEALAKDYQLKIREITQTNNDQETRINQIEASPINIHLLRAITTNELLNLANEKAINDLTQFTTQALRKANQLSNENNAETTLLKSQVEYLTAMLLRLISSIELMTLST